MRKPDLSLNHAHELIERITQGDDGAHAAELLELIHAVADPNNVVAIEVQKHLYSLTPDFQSHFLEYMENLKVA
jgi:hypothetical protein